MVDGSRMPRRVLHTSDLHLEKLGDRACHSLEALVNLAIKTKVDLVIIAGDLFDHNRVNESLINFVVEQLQRLPMYVAILPGNHDCLNSDSVYHRVEVWQDANNIRVFQAPQGETLTLPGLSLWGKSITSYEYDDDPRPLAGIPHPQRDGRWHIAVAHGYYVHSEPEPPIPPDLYITHEEIITSGQDYIALGHSVSFRCVCDEPVKAYYSGSPAWSFQHNTVNIVDFMDEAGVQVTRCPL